MISRRHFLHLAAAVTGSIPFAGMIKLYAAVPPGTEQEVRRRLGIPSSAKYVLILDQAAHMDWDWNYTFLEYFMRPAPIDNKYGVDVILTEAVGLLGENSNPRTKPPRYYYSLCEIGYFQEFIETKIAAGVDIVPIIRKIGSYLRIVGGGITSPDCLLCSGEGFLRNYLLGKLYLAGLFPELLPLKHCWIPDDFGQDPELPIAAQALGMVSVSFSRLPGLAPGNTPDLSFQTEMLTSGADFWWTASDNASRIYTHWMPAVPPDPGYFQGGALESSNGDPDQIVAAIQAFLAYNNPDLTTFTPPFSGAPSNYIYLPLDDDFMFPIADLLKYANTWNVSEETGGVYAVEASYDDFTSLVLSSGAKLTSKVYNGTPYWTGYYMSRPGLKILHYGTTRFLLAAETFGLLGFGASPSSHPFWTSVSQAWKDFAPSTHHDYVCGTAADDVVTGEQMPLLQKAYGEATAAIETALDELGAAAGTPGEVLIANPAGTAFAGLVELSGPVPPSIRSIRIGGTLIPAQSTFEGGLAFNAPMPSMAYTIGMLSSQAAPPFPVATITPKTSGSDEYTLKNEFMTVVIGADLNWGISAIEDASGDPLLASGSTGNDLVFYTDDGNLFQFANEIDGDTTFAPVAPTFPAGAGSAVILESGPVRVRLSTDVTVSVGGSTQLFTREYSLVAGEPFLRMTTTGAAGSGYSVMAAFPLASPVDSIVHGTPCHWTSVQPHRLWSAPIFLATQNFLLPSANGKVLAAIYHPEVPAWSFDQKGVLLGCLLRNTPGMQRGANGTDDGTHSLHYAFRVPTALEPPATGQPLSEALNYVAPAVARIVSDQSTSAGLLPSSGSVASVSSPGFILAAKPGDVVPGTLVLRIYNPSNSPQTLTVTLGPGRPASVRAVTALEDPIFEDAPVIQITDTGFRIHVARALNTVQISFPKQRRAK
jgi:alpha-mannosidase